MPEETFAPYKVHQGLNIKRIRMAEKMKQDTFARILSISQQLVSKYENTEVLEEEVIEKCAKALNVPAELIKNTPEDLSSQTQNFRDIKVTSSKGGIGNILGTSNVTNYFCDEELMTMLKDNLAFLKNENKDLRSENEELRKEIELLNSQKEGTTK